MLTLTFAVLLRWLVNVIGWLALAVFTRCVPNDSESGLTSNWVMPVPVNWKESPSIWRFIDFPPGELGWKLTVAIHSAATLLSQVVGLVEVARVRAADVDVRVVRDSSCCS